MEITALQISSRTSLGEPGSSFQLPRNRYVRLAGIWLAIVIFQALVEVSGLASTRSALAAEWQYFIGALAAVGFLLLVLLALRLFERTVELAVAKFPNVRSIIHVAIAALLTVACVVAPLALRQAIQYHDQLRLEGRPNPSIERTCPGKPGHAAHVER